MAGPANQAAANQQAIAESLAAKAYGTIGGIVNSVSIDVADSAVDEDDWTGGDFDDFVYDPSDTGDWDERFDSVEGLNRNTVFLARSAPLKAPYGGGWDNDQFED